MSGGSGLGRRLSATRAGFERWTAPALSGLPRWPVLLWFPILAALVTTVLIALGISGTSSGAHWSVLGDGTDPRLISGVPRGIRSDEWLVQQGWIVSQYLRGFPAHNPMFPGGMDMTVFNDLPTWDWSSLFRPHVWGYLLLGLDSGVAWHWWIPVLGLVTACYLFLISLMPRRPLTAAILSASMVFTPFLQWWYFPSTWWCVAWPLLGMAGVIWMLKERRLWVRVVWAAAVGYVAVTMAMGLYLPFILPGVIVFLFFSVGYLLRARPWADGGTRAVFGRLAPILIAGAAALVVVALYAITRWSTFMAVQSTLYPGQRFDPTGSVRIKDPLLLGFTGAPWNAVLKSITSTTILGLNSSESASVILLAVFLLPALIWFAVRSFRRGRSTEWLIIAVLACMALIGAYLLIPGWDAIAHLLQIDRVPPERFRIAFVVLLPVSAALVVDYIDRHRAERVWIAGVVSAGFTAVLLAADLYLIKTRDPQVLAASGAWKVILVLLVLAVFLFFVRRGVVVAATLLLVSSVLMGWGVNPAYRGVFDLSKTAAGQAIDTIDAEDPGTWVGIGTYEMMALLTESDVDSLSGVQNYPSQQMWAEIDPSGEFEDYWNRLAHVQWSFGDGEPVVVNPQADVVSVTLDPCSDFAQEHVDYVVTTTAPDSTECLLVRDQLTQGRIPITIYQVVPSAG